MVETTELKSTVSRRSDSTDLQSDLEKHAATRSQFESNLDAIAEEDSVGYREYREGLNLTYSSTEEKKIRWKIDLIVLPIFLITQALQFMDRTALNYANLFNYQTALHLHGDQFNYLSGMIYAGYFFGQYPAMWLIGRFPAQRVIACACLFWGTLVVILTQCRSYSSALTVRFLMGLFEAAVTPGLTLMTGFWYTRREIPLRQCIWYSSLGWGGIIGSYIAMGISRLPASAKPERWQLTFYILGGATMIWSILIFLVLPDTPSNARFLNERECIIAVKRVAGNETGIKNKKFDKKQLLVAFVDTKMILLFIGVFAAAIPNGVVNSFSTVIIRDMGFSTTKTAELKSVGDAVQIIALLIGGVITLNVRNSRLLTATLFNTLCVVCSATMAYLPRSNTWGRLVSFWLVNSQSVGFTVSLVTISSNMGGYTHRSVASAIVL
jgi:sugar phosphate permease